MAKKPFIDMGTPEVTCDMFTCYLIWSAAPDFLDNKPVQVELDIENKGKWEVPARAREALEKTMANSNMKLYGVF